MTNSAVISTFNEMKKVTEVDHLVAPLKRLSDTRWSCRYLSLKGILKTLPAVIRTLEEVSQGTHASRTVEARGLLVQVRSFKFILLLEIFVKILAITNALSEQIQNSQLVLGAAARLVCSVTKAISSARQDKEWDRTWTAAIDRAQSSNADLPTVGRSRQRPRQIDDFVLMESTGRRDQPSGQDDPKTFHRTHTYYPVIDAMSSEMDRRFSSTNRMIMTGVSACYPKAATFMSADALNGLAKHYDLDSDSLNTECTLAKDYLKDNNLLCIGDVIRALLPISSAVPVLLKVLQLSVTIGDGSAGCERSFSSLARIKTKLHSTMGEGRLTNLAVLSIERDLSGALDINAVIDRFSSVDQGRRLRLSRVCRRRWHLQVVRYLF